MNLGCLMSVTTRELRHIRRTSLRRFSAVLALCALVIAQLLPGIAAASGTGEWVEICSESGVVLKQVELGGSDTPESDPQMPCPDCMACVFCAALDSAAVLSDPISAAAIAARTQRGTMGSQDAPTNPAQFWPDNRGPPRAEEQITSTGTRVLAKVSTLTIGGAPWL